MFRRATFCGLKNSGPPNDFSVRFCSAKAWGGVGLLGRLGDNISAPPAGVGRAHIRTQLRYCITAPINYLIFFELIAALDRKFP